MIHSHLTRTLPAICAALMMAACGGEGGSTPSTSTAATQVASGKFSFGGSSMTLKAPEQGMQPMAGYSNLGDTCYANSALKFIIHSIGPLKLKQHLATVAEEGDDALQSAAASFTQLIERTNSTSEVTWEEMWDFMSVLRQLPAFHDFPLVDQQQDVIEFLAKLSQAFALHTRYADTVTLGDAYNAAKTDSEYWTILRSESADDSLQDIFDRTQPADWRIRLNAHVQHLTVGVHNMAYDAQNIIQVLGTEKFDFNQNVSLRITDGDRTHTLTLEPREVIAFDGIDNNGHYVVYAKDDQWVRYSDSEVDVVGQMPPLKNARLINFAITKIESTRSDFTPDAS